MCVFAAPFSTKIQKSATLSLFGVVLSFVGSNSVPDKNCGMYHGSLAAFISRMNEMCVLMDCRGVSQNWFNTEHIKILREGCSPVSVHMASGDLSRVANPQAFVRTSRMGPHVSNETMTMLLIVWVWHDRFWFRFLQEHSFKGSGRGVAVNRLWEDDFYRLSPLLGTEQSMADSSLQISILISARLSLSLKNHKICFHYRESASLLSNTISLVMPGALLLMLEWGAGDKIQIQNANTTHIMNRNVRQQNIIYKLLANF